MTWILRRHRFWKPTFLKCFLSKLKHQQGAWVLKFLVWKAPFSAFWRRISVDERLNRKKWCCISIIFCRVNRVWYTIFLLLFCGKVWHILLPLSLFKKPLWHIFWVSVNFAGDKEINWRLTKLEGSLSYPFTSKYHFVEQAKDRVKLYMICIRHFDASVCLTHIRGIEWSYSI